MADDRRAIPLTAVAASTLATTDPPEREYLDGFDLFPAAEFSFLSGAGAAGKTGLCLQLAMATASYAEQSHWLGRPIKMQGPVAFYSGEEDLNELHRRLHEIAAADPSIDLRDLSRLHLIDKSIASNKALITATGPTPTFKALEQFVGRKGISLLILDNRAQLCAINELDRNQATATVNHFRGLAKTFGTTTILLQHPSLSGLKTGSSGSTGFSNTARNFIHLARPNGKDEDPDGSEDDGRRILRVQKANGGKMGRVINLQWSLGAYICTDQPPPRAGFDVGRPQKAERIFLALLDWHNTRGISVSMNTRARNFAPTVFVAHPDRGDCSLKELTAAMHALDKSGKIRSVQYGPPSDDTYRLEVVKCNP